jgi:predicted unusual protein kinase regulating ubiquinone biosynthesis (AarF/ABC1/UbiB family)
MVRSGHVMQRRKLAHIYFQLPCLLVLAVHVCRCFRLTPIPGNSAFFAHTTHSQLLSSTAPDQEATSRSRTWVQRRSPDSFRRRTRSDSSALEPPGKKGHPSGNTGYVSPTTIDRPEPREATVVPSPVMEWSYSPLSRRRKINPLPITGYDAAAIEDYYNGRPFQVGWRLNSLGFPLLGTRLLFSFFRSYAVRNSSDPLSAWLFRFAFPGWYFRLLVDKALRIDRLEFVQRKRGAELRATLVHSKSVALIKSGQALSLRPDLIRNPIWAEELGKLVDAVGSFSDIEAMRIVRRELHDLEPRLKVTRSSWLQQKPKEEKGMNRLEKFVAGDDILSLFEFYNGNSAVASASIGQVYKARIRPGPQLEAAIGKTEADRWGGKLVAIKVQRPDVEASASLDMYLLRRTAVWLSKFRGGACPLCFGLLCLLHGSSTVWGVPGDLPQIADAFGMQLFGELDYVREANNCERFKALYRYWNDILVPSACTSLTRRRVLVMEWVDGEKGPWNGQDGIDMVRIGLRCSVDQLMSTGLFHADPHRGNLIRTPDGKLALIDFGMMADIDESERYGLFGLVIGLQNKDLSLVTENLLQVRDCMISSCACFWFFHSVSSSSSLTVFPLIWTMQLGFLKDTAQLNTIVVRLREALMNATGGTGKASDVNFARLQAELDAISRENVLQFSTPPFFTIIIRSLTILEGIALSVDKNFRLVRGSYPYVLNQLLYPEDNERTPASLEKLLIRLLTVNGEQKEIEWERLRDLLVLAQKASKVYEPSSPEDSEAEDKVKLSRRSIEVLSRFFTSRTCMFLKKPLVHEIAEAIDAMASMGEANLKRQSGGILPLLPGMNGPVNSKRMDEMSVALETFQDALLVSNNPSQARMDAIMQVFRAVTEFFSDERIRQDAGPLLEQLQSVIQMVAVEVLEIRGTRAVRSILRL